LLNKTGNSESSEGKTSSSSEQIAQLQETIAELEQREIQLLDDLEGVGFFKNV